MKVKDGIRLLESKGLTLIQFNGSHRQYQHPTKSGTVTLAGHPNQDLPKGTWNSILKQAGLKGQK